MFLVYVVCPKFLPEYQYSHIFWGSSEVFRFSKNYVYLVLHVYILLWELV